MANGLPGRYGSRRDMRPLYVLAIAAVVALNIVLAVRDRQAPATQPSETESEQEDVQGDGTTMGVIEGTPADEDGTAASGGTSGGTAADGGVTDAGSNAVTQGQLQGQSDGQAGTGDTGTGTQGDEGTTAQQTSTPAPTDDTQQQAQDTGQPAAATNAMVPADLRGSSDEQRVRDEIARVLGDAGITTVTSCQEGVSWDGEGTSVWTYDVTDDSTGIVASYAVAHDADGTWEVSGS